MYRKHDGQEQDEQQNDQFHSHLLRVVRAQIQALTHFFLLSVAGKAGKQILSQYLLAEQLSEKVHGSRCSSQYSLSISRLGNNNTCRGHTSITVEEFPSWNLVPVVGLFILLLG
jgi:hypothetical protein